MPPRGEGFQPPVVTGKLIEKPQELPPIVGKALDTDIKDLLIPVAEDPHADSNDAPPDVIIGKPVYEMGQDSDKLNPSDFAAQLRGYLQGFAKRQNIDNSDSIREAQRAMNAEIAKIDPKALERMTPEQRKLANMKLVEVAKQAYFTKKQVVKQPGAQQRAV